MEKISLNNVIPNVFSEMGKLQSDVWNTEFCLERGQTYLIEAASGKGKSSLCSFLYGYREDYSGSIIFNANDIKTLRSSVWDMIRVRELSLLFQELNLFPELTAMENILLKNNLTKHKSQKQIDDMFDMLGIEDKKTQRIEKMSWGQQQRVAIMRCLCQPFDFILLDEPISHLDDENASLIAKLITKEALERNAGVIVTSIGKHLPLDYTKRLEL